tara:strand:+ start:744 stop:1607 length:864 start_codon:yes stop_codon:yes gene_type:complete
MQTAKDIYNKINRRIKGEGFLYGDESSKQSSLDKQLAKQEANRKLNAYEAEKKALERELKDSGLSEKDIKERKVDSKFLIQMFAPKGVQLDNYKNDKEQPLLGLYPAEGYYNLFNEDNVPVKAYMLPYRPVEGAEDEPISNKKIVQGYADKIKTFYTNNRIKFFNTFTQGPNNGGNRVVNEFEGKKEENTILDLYLEAKMGCHNVNPDYRRGTFVDPELGANSDKMCKTKMQVFKELEDLQKALSSHNDSTIFGFGGARKSKRKSKKSKKSKRKSKKTKRKTRRSKK